MKITSTVFKHEGKIPPKYTCDGDNTSPPLFIEGVPENTKSLVLLMDDPDVPKRIREDGMWDHWIVFNIPPGTKELPEGKVPPGLVGVNTSGGMTYQGPCPPDREHRYFFKLYALDTMFDLAKGATKADVEKAMKLHIIAKAELIGRYERS